MIQVEIIYLGGEKETYYKDAANEYIKRLGAFCSFSEKIIKDEKLPQNPSDNEIKTALEKEADRILAELKPKHLKIAMCIEGKQMSSEELATTFNDVPMRGLSGITFIIGSSEGLSERVKKACDIRLSMSKMTFPHRLARVMLLEQIYRAFSICSGKKYHK
ncbi:MAG: 23S rRNA (pseudouridine(1915)-N(3))-methyltransferase RlmH [Clostridia bacterium]|nr:23S rRNA (pseudouridine(1915)-N(3))-methyltransferase RlmH [Clostridia bacterium]